MTATIHRLPDTPAETVEVPFAVLAADISARALLTYCVMRAHLRPDGSLPFRPDLAARFGVSPSYLNRGVRELKDAGLLSTLRRWDPDTYQQWTEYVLLDRPEAA